MKNVNKIKNYSPEEFIYKLFETAGWTVKFDDRKQCGYCPDLSLYKQDELYGYVEVISHLSDEKLNKKLIQIKHFFKENKTKVLIITDSINYYVVYKNDVKNICWAPTPEELELITKEVSQDE